MKRASLSFVAALAIAGCAPSTSPSNPETIIVQGPEGSTVNLIRLDQAGGQADGAEFSIKQGVLFVSEGSYGEVKLGDKVKIERDGAVRVNGDLRAPNPIFR